MFFRYRGVSLAVALMGKLFVAEDLVLIWDNEDRSLCPILSFLRHDTRYQLVGEALKQNYLPVAGWLCILMSLMRCTESELSHYHSYLPISQARASICLGNAPLLPASEYANKESILIPTLTLYLLSPTTERPSVWDTLEILRKRVRRATFMLHYNSAEKENIHVTESVQSMKNSLVHRLRQEASLGPSPALHVGEAANIDRTYIEAPVSLTQEESEMCSLEWNRSLAFAMARLTGN